MARFDFQAADLELGGTDSEYQPRRPEHGTGRVHDPRGICEQRMRTRTGFDMHQIRRVLERKGVVMLAPPDYRKDQESLKKYSDRIRLRLCEIL